MTASAIVLAGGRSSRFGSPKLRALVDGVPLLHLAVRAVAAVADEVVIVGPRSGGVAPSDFDGLPAGVRVAVVLDPVEDGGPLIGLRAGLAAATGDRLVVVGGDMPRLEPAVLRAMLERLPNGPAAGRTSIGQSSAVTVSAPKSADGVLLGQAGGARPLPLAASTNEARRAVEAAVSEGERSLHAALARLTVVEVPADEWRRLDPSGHSLLDVDTPADLDDVGGTQADDTPLT